jgi:hypothetical protein
MEKCQLGGADPHRSSPKWHHIHIHFWGTEQWFSCLYSLSLCSDVLCLMSSLSDVLCLMFSVWCALSDVISVWCHLWCHLWHGKPWAGHIELAKLHTDTHMHIIMLSRRRTLSVRLKYHMPEVKSDVKPWTFSLQQSKRAPQEDQSTVSCLSFNNSSTSEKKLLKLSHKGCVPNGTLFPICLARAHNI